MLDETGMMGMHKKEEPQSQPKAAPKQELPKIFSPDKMTPAEMAGAGVVMLGNIAFVSWWAMNDEPSEVIEMIDTPSLPVTPAVVSPSGLPSVVPSLPTQAPPETVAITPILEVAEINQEGTFKEAFDAARAQVGPGGIFKWHGQWYNTYTAEEWTGMEPTHKEDYASLVKPFLENETPFHPAVPEYDALTGQDTHSEVAYSEDSKVYPPDTHHPESHGLHPPADTHLDTLDDLFLHT
ncbi:MAG: hypothetical protein U0X91_04185 [Spirosomataceae bacterium]